MKKIGVIIIGGTGFGAGELLRLFTMHPEVEIVSVVSQSSAGKTISSAHPHLTSFYNQNFDPTFDSAVLKGYEKKIIISALPHGESGKGIASHFETNLDCIFIDLSGDLRLQDEQSHLESYPNSPLLQKLREQTIYGLSELNFNKIKEARIIANPGCLATACILALLPIAKLSIEKEIMIHAATGSSGAGKEPRATTHHPVRHANFSAYKPLFHQHLPEITETLKHASLDSSDISFVPHSLPVSRGILSTVFIKAKKNYSKEDVYTMFRSYYEKKTFVRVQKEGSAELENVVCSNMCDISIAVRDKTIIIHSAIDNLVKGMAGQAIQNLNICCGLPETTGLWFPSVRPV